MQLAIGSATMYRKLKNYGLITAKRMAPSGDQGETDSSS